MNIFYSAVLTRCIFFARLSTVHYTEVNVKIIHPDDSRANVFAEHVVSVLIERNKADKSIATDTELKNLFAMWLVFLSEVHPEELDDARMFVHIALENQRVLIGLADEKRRNGEMGGRCENPQENARAISFWNPILIPFAAMHLTGNKEVGGEVYAAYWDVFAAHRTFEFFPRLPLKEISAEAKDVNEKAEEHFVADIKLLTHALLADHYEAAFRLDLKGDDPEEFAKYLFANWEDAWQMLSSEGTKDMRRHTARLYFLLKHLGNLLALDYSNEFANQVTAQIEEHIKHGWHEVVPQ